MKETNNHQGWNTNFAKLQQYVVQNNSIEPNLHQNKTLAQFLENNRTRLEKNQYENQAYLQLAIRIAFFCQIVMGIIAKNKYLAWRQMIARKITQNDDTSLKSNLNEYLKPFLQCPSWNIPQD